MLQRIREARKNESGFTLIELLIVIVILGVLAGIVVFAVSGIKDRGDVAACKADLKTVEVAQEAYYAQPPTGQPPAYAASLTVLKTAGFLKDDNSKYVTTGISGVVTKVAGAPGDC
jgi:general secretion pathway protein G